MAAYFQLVGSFLYADGTRGSETCSREVFPGVLSTRLIAGAYPLSCPYPAELGSGFSR
jgi:hypothetical protein